jgi:hypothetical protein
MTRRQGHGCLTGTDAKANIGARERVAEIGEILALGLVRLKARQSSHLSADRGESSLASLADQSGHANGILHRETRS